MSGSTREYELKLSEDNFSSALVSFLKALTAINDDEDAIVFDVSYDLETKLWILKIRSTTEKQLYLSFGYPDES